MNDAPPACTPQQAAQLLEADRQQRATTALQAINATLEQHRCQLIARPAITPDGRLTANIQLEPLP
jgi:hypothetical protein